MCVCVRSQPGDTHYEHHIITSYQYDSDRVTSIVHSVISPTIKTTTETIQMTQLSYGSDVVNKVILLNRDVLVPKTKYVLSFYREEYKMYL